MTHNNHVLDRIDLLTLPGLAAANQVVVLPHVDSTNAWLMRSATEQAYPDVTVVVADHQVAGRGRHQRVWETPAGAAVTMSILVRPSGIPMVRWPWLTMMMGLSVTVALREHYGLDVQLKWPNDVLWQDSGKMCGVLAEVVRPQLDDPAIAVGVGINVTQTRADLLDTAESLASAGVTAPSRVAVVGQVVAEFTQWYHRWGAASGDPVASGLLAAVSKNCGTIGRAVRLHMPDGSEPTGIATGITHDGSLTVECADGHTLVVAAGDVHHVRPEPMDQP